MDVDPAAAAGLRTREVSSGTRDGTPTRIVIARRIYPTDREDLWDALTNVERIPRWFLPVSGDLRVGGHYRLEGNASGVVESCEAPERFAVTWEFGGGMSWVEVLLAPTEGGTVFELRHSAPVDPEFWAEYGAGAGGVGWDLGLLGLALHLQSGAGRVPEHSDDWATTPAGIEFVRESAVGWAGAAIADGDDPAEARAAAERTVTFYTVDPDAAPEG